MNNEDKILGLLETLVEKVDHLEAGQATTNARLDTIEGDVAALKADMAKHNHLVEPQLNAIQEGISGLQERYHQVDSLEDKVDDHGIRLYALEQTVKGA